MKNVFMSSKKLFSFLRYSSFSIFEKEIRCDIETSPIDRVLNKEHFYGKIMQKMYTKS